MCTRAGSGHKRPTSAPQTFTISTSTSGPPNSPKPSHFQTILRLMAICLHYDLGYLGENDYRKMLRKDQIAVGIIALVCEYMGDGVSVDAGVGVGVGVAFGRNRVSSFGFGLGRRPNQSPTQSLFRSQPPPLCCTVPLFRRVPPRRR